MKFIATLALSTLLAATVTAQPMRPPEQMEAPAKTTVTLDPVKVQGALNFLKKAEEKNKSTQGIEAEFGQVRVDGAAFGDRIESKGHFWYQAPGRFRADYQTEYPSTIWILNDVMYDYNHLAKQVTEASLKTGGDASINQLLLGFGIKVDEIKKIFDVAISTAKPEAKQIGIDFFSRDIDRSMQFQKITIFFDEDTAEPRKILAFDDQDGEVTITLNKVKFNPKIDQTKFKTSWPKDTEIVK